LCDAQPLIISAATALIAKIVFFIYSSF